MTKKLKHTKDRVIIKIDTESKNWHTFEDGTKIRREREYNELNKRLTAPVNATVISAEDIPEGVEILIHQNAIHDVNKLFNHGQPVSENKDENIGYYSIHERECFFWLDENGQWQPLKGYATGLRVFKPYTGALENVEPTLIPDTLYVTSGEFKGQVVRTLKACDYQIVFQDTNGREGNLIRFRPYGNEKENYEPEIVALLHDLTEQVNKGKLLVGLTTSDAKTI